MPASSTFPLYLSLFLTLLFLLPPKAYAFGAGDIPDFAYLNDKAFRHGDIENILSTVVKSVGGGAMGGGLLGFAQSVISSATGGATFSRSDVKRVYFVSCIKPLHTLVLTEEKGNWLRDYSQAMDIAGLSKLTADTIILLVSVLGFMTFGFATEEFQVTADRLGVYLPVEHIDNPKGYAEKEGDARQFHPKLRPPVDPRELEIDERTGMKKYIATEDEGWDTSTAFIRRILRACIEQGRQAGGQENADLWEAYRLLGTGMHTLEDLLAHSNWCELTLRKMGHENVFCHVGDDVIIDTPNGPAPPLVTGTFGGADFLHSLLGEATDKLSQASVTDLSDKINKASQGENENVEALRVILNKLPSGGGDDSMNKGEEIHEHAKAYNFNPDDVAPPDVQKQLLELLKWRDDIYRDVLAKIEMVPGLSDLLEELTNALNAYVYTVLAPYLTPLLSQASGVLNEGSKAVIDSADQYAVFDDPRASDPSHSLLSKDHFGLILNEPAGKIAQLVVVYSVNLIVKAWADDNEPDNVINEILEAFHHPYYATGQSRIQNKMFEEMEKWIGGLGSGEAENTIRALTKESVRNGKNKRLGSDETVYAEPGYGNNRGAGSQYGATSSYGTQTSSHYSQNQPSGRYNDPRLSDIDSRYQGDSGVRYGERASETRTESREERNRVNQYSYTGGNREEREHRGYGNRGYGQPERSEHRGGAYDSYRSETSRRDNYDSGDGYAPDRSEAQGYDDSYRNSSHRNQEGSYNTNEHTRRNDHLYDSNRDSYGDNQGNYDQSSRYGTDVTQSSGYGTYEPSDTVSGSSRYPTSDRNTSEYTYGGGDTYGSSREEHRRDNRHRNDSDSDGKERHEGRHHHDSSESDEYSRLGGGERGSYRDNDEREYSGYDRRRSGYEDNSDRRGTYGMEGLTMRGDEEYESRRGHRHRNEYD
ncbi:hypothetical protein AMATHDRAFT_46432 [Amanita thiersii Skay4041]|uniref:Het-C-domain-containing protein n=1 Tax=Amanita thiersii Skay4041 TaxID=703135 RepID=A0A2A9NVI0_9AGAR|nr:hypothetical protein AMATHDRAFT_46432 [Amanita thiersii Skay4041]